MKNQILRYFLVFSLFLTSIFLFPHCTEKGKETLSAPDFSLKALDGQEITLSKLKGKAVLLDFWATWCGPCRESIPHLVQLYKGYKDNGFEVIGMNVDKGDIDTVRRFVKSMDIPYPIVTASEKVTRNYAVTGLPTTVLIDRKGRIRQKYMGFTVEIAKQMTSLVADLTSEKP